MIKFNFLQLKIYNQKIKCKTLILINRKNVKYSSKMKFRKLKNKTQTYKNKSRKIIF